MHDKKNITQLWQENKRKLPIAVWVDSWATYNFAIIHEMIYPNKWGFYQAYGYYFFKGIKSKYKKIENAGCYRWERYDEDFFIRRSAKAKKSLFEI